MNEHIKSNTKTINDTKCSFSYLNCNCDDLSLCVSSLASQFPMNLPANRCSKLLFTVFATFEKTSWLVTDEISGTVTVTHIQRCRK